MTTRPIDATTSEKEYKLQDHLGSTRVVLHQGGAVLGTYDYEPYGGRLISTGPEPRKGFIDKEKDDESNLGDFGRRKYDDGIGRFTSIDPLWESFRSWSPYVYSYNSPVQFVDPSGESAVATIKGDVITVEATLHFYGDAASTYYAEWYANQIQKEMNEGAKGGVVINGKKYTVKFKITGKILPAKNVHNTIVKNTDYRNNYIYLSQSRNWEGKSYMDHFEDDKKGGGNTGGWLIDGPKGENPYTTPVHEFVHGLGFSGGDALGHEALDLQKESPPNIMVPGRGSPEQVRWSHLRIVYPRTIAKIFEGKDLTKGTVNLGRLTNGVHQN